MFTSQIEREKRDIKRERERKEREGWEREKREREKEGERHACMCKQKVQACSKRSSFSQSVSMCDYII